jgi:LmbE family N-acetylglucosaminyl deacetylase
LEAFSRSFIKMKDCKNLNMLRRVFLGFLFCLCACSYVWAQTALPAFNKDDRVLVLAPHPDDESIGTAGVIQRALEAGAQVKVVCYTNGDNNEFAFIVYERRLTFRKAEFLHMGEVRGKETMAAMRSLGIGEQDVNYMGYPDFGTMDILTQYWDAKRPYRSMFPRVQEVSYQNAMSVGAPFTGESILRDIETIVMAFKPTRIFVSHPADTNRDHQSLYLFLHVALWDLEGRIPQPQVYPYLVHVIGWPVPRGKHPKLALTPPKDLVHMAWQQLILTDKELVNKEKAIAFHKSQIAYNPPYLFTFVRSNELYGDFEHIILKRPDSESIDWKSVETGSHAKGKDNGNGSFLYYAVGKKDLLIKVALRKKLDKRLGLYINLLGYNKSEKFADMPKLAITVGLLRMRIKDQQEVVFIKDASLRFEGNTAYISIPLASLGNPDYILARVRRRLFRVPLDVASWRILEVR